MLKKLPDSPGVMIRKMCGCLHFPMKERVEREGEGGGEGKWV